MYHWIMIPDFFQFPEPVANIGLWKSIIGLLIVLLATFVGVEITLENEDEEQWFLYAFIFHNNKSVNIFILKFNFNIKAN